MAEIKVERRRGILPWILGLVVLVLMIWAVSRSVSDARRVDDDRGAAAADALRDDTPPRLRQYARATEVESAREESVREMPAGIAA